MAITIGSNIASLNAQRRLSDGTSQLSKVYEKLSSGLRINRASDDAAGLSISESLKSDRRIFNQGVRNFNDGVSLLNVADGAIEQLSGIVMRLKELAEQSANGTYGNKQRSSLDAEAQALSKEYLRIAQSTNFNGRYLFNGGLGELRLQGGYGLDGGIQSGLGGAIGTGTFSTRTTYVAGLNPYDIVSNDFNNDGILDLATSDSGASTMSVLLGRGDGSFSTPDSYNVGFGTFPVTINSGDYNGDGIADITVLDQNTSPGLYLFTGRGNGTFNSRVTINLGGAAETIATGDFNGDGNLDIAGGFGASTRIYIGNGNGTFTQSASIAGPAPSVTIGDVNSDGYQDIVEGFGSSIRILTSKGDGTFNTEITYSAGGTALFPTLGDYNGDGKLDIASADNINFVRVMIGNGDGTFGASTGYQVAAAPTEVANGDFNGDGFMDLVVSGVGSTQSSLLLGNGDGTFKTQTTFLMAVGNSLISGDLNGDGVSDIAVANYASNTVAVRLNQTNEGISPLLSFSLKTKSESLQSLTQFDKALTRLSTQRGKIGAFQSRLNVGTNVLQASSENYAAAEGRIRNADIAAESSDLTRLKILQNAATSVLSQANLQPRLALLLLRN